ncbi:MAG TPA: hypothetical protein VKT28_04060 [Puia sp.]|nr:hypothetical protein [Puia sp.]
MRSKFFFLISIVAIVSCNEKKLPPPKSFRLIIPDTAKSKAAKIIYDGLEVLSANLSLYRLDKGVDSFEMRLWISSYLEPNNVIILKYAEQKWIPTKMSFWFESLRFDSAKIYRLNLKQKDISSIVDSIEKFDLIGIPMQDEIPNFRDTVPDAFIYTIEIATKDYYKVMSYHCPDYYVKEKYNKRITDFLFFIKRRLVGSDFQMCKP